MCIKIWATLFISLPPLPSPTTKKKKKLCKLFLKKHDDIIDITALSWRSCQSFQFEASVPLIQLVFKDQTLPPRLQMVYTNNLKFTINPFQFLLSLTQYSNFRISLRKYERTFPNVGCLCAWFHSWDQVTLQLPCRLKRSGRLGQVWERV